MSDFNYEFRVLIETENGHKYSYGSSSLVSLPANQSKVITTEQMVSKINTMPSMSYYNAPAFTTSSALYDTPPLVTIDIDRFSNPSAGLRTFIDTTLPDGITEHDDVSYQFVSCSIKDHNLSGSIFFHSNTTPTNDATGNDIIKKYKFWGNKVCQVLGVPENYWIYSDKFVLSNTGSESNYLSGDVLATSLNLKSNFAINNAGSITSDLPFRHFKEADRFVRWTDVSSSIPINKMHIGYHQHRDEYGIEMPNQDHFHLSASAVTASGEFLVEGNLTSNINITGLHITASGDLGCGDDLFVGDDIHAPNIGTGTDNSVVILDTDGKLKTDEINSDVWSTSKNFVDATGGANNEVATFTDSDTITGEGNLTFDGYTLETVKLISDYGATTAPSLTHEATTGQIFQNENSEFAFGLDNASPWSLWIQGRTHTDSARAISLNPMGGAIAINTRYPASNMELTVEGDISASGDINVAGNYNGYLPMSYMCGAQIGSSPHDPAFLGFWGQSSGYWQEDENPDTNESINRMIAPFDGYVHSVILRANSAAGTCTMQLYKSTTGTSADDCDANTFGASVTENQSATSTPVRYDFGTSYTFNAGDVLAVRWDPGGDANDTDGQLILMCKIT